MKRDRLERAERKELRRQERERRRAQAQQGGKVAPTYGSGTDDDDDPGLDDAAIDAGVDIGDYIDDPVRSG